MPFSGALLTRSADLSVSNDTFQLIDWDVIEYDVGGYVDLGTDDGRLVMPADGYYEFGCNSRWSDSANGSAGVRGIGVWRNDDDPQTIENIGYNEWPSSSLAGALMHQTPHGAPRHFTAGEWIRCYAYQYSGGALILDAIGGTTPCFWVRRVG